MPMYGKKIEEKKEGEKKEREKQIQSKSVLYNRHYRSIGNWSRGLSASKAVALIGCIQNNDY